MTPARGEEGALISPQWGGPQGGGSDSRYARGGHRIRICVERTLISVIVVVMTYCARMFQTYSISEGDMAQITITVELAESW